MLLRRENLLEHDTRRYGARRRLRGSEALRVVLINVISGRPTLDKVWLIQQLQ